MTTNWQPMPTIPMTVTDQRVCIVLYSDGWRYCYCAGVYYYDRDQHYYWQWPTIIGRVCVCYYYGRYWHYQCIDHCVLLLLLLTIDRRDWPSIITVMMATQYCIVDDPAWPNSCQWPNWWPNANLIVCCYCVAINVWRPLPGAIIVWPMPVMTMCYWRPLMTDQWLTNANDQCQYWTWPVLCRYWLTDQRPMPMILPCDDQPNRWPMTPADHGWLLLPDCQPGVLMANAASWRPLCWRIGQRDWPVTNQWPVIDQPMTVTMTHDQWPVWQRPVLAITNGQPVTWQPARPTLWR